MYVQSVNEGSTAWNEILHLNELGSDQNNLRRKTNEDL